MKLQARADRDTTQVWIVGSGPAALLLGEACVARGLRVGLLAPAPRTAWAPNYAMWLDDALALDAEPWIDRRWAHADAYLSGGVHSLERGYALLDAGYLQRDCLARCETAGARVEVGTLVEIIHDDEGVELRLRDAAPLHGRIVIDATGHGSRFVSRESGPPPAYQIAWGEQRELEGAFDRDRVCFMDWRASGPQEAEDSLPPTFLYAMPLDAERLFVEETVLAARVEQPSSSFAALEARLHRRLRGLGHSLHGAASAVERCIIPMGGPLPRGDQRTLAFGGAASMVHPVTGYMLTNVLRRRLRVADAIANELDAWVGPGGPSRRIWQAIWTPDEVRAWRLYGFGLEVLCALDRAGLDRFFTEFFELSDDRWRAFVSASASSPALMDTMLRYFVRASGPIRGRLSGALMGREGLRLLRGFAGLAGT